MQNLFLQSQSRDESLSDSLDDPFHLLLTDLLIDPDSRSCIKICIVILGLVQIAFVREIQTAQSLSPIKWTAQCRNLLLWVFIEIVAAEEM